jgi:hypothetical protein
MGVILLLHGVAFAGAPDCTHADVQRGRDAAEKKMKQKDYKGAVDTLRAIDKDCILEPVGVDDKKPPAQATLDFYWLKSDLSDALFHAGLPVDCQRVLAPLLVPRRPYGLELFAMADSKVASAIQYNMKTCQAAHEKRFTGFTATKCTDGTGVATRDACLIFDAATASVKDDDQKDNPDVAQVCPSVRMRRGSKESVLKAKGGPLADPYSCCNIDGFTVGTINGKPALRFGGGGNACGGGTMVGNVDALYEWNAQELKFLEDNHVNEH